MLIAIRMFKFIIRIIIPLVSTKVYIFQSNFLTADDESLTIIQQ